MLSYTFNSLFQYMTTTLEDDDAVARDEKFERAQSKKWLLANDAHPDEDIEYVLERESKRMDSFSDENIEDALKRRE
jgi:hypothetical protein